MLKSLSVAVLATIVCFAGAAAQDAQSILKTMREKQVQRWATVQNYTVHMSLRGAPEMARSAPIYYQRTTVGGRPAFRMVPQKEYMRAAMRQAGCPEMTPDQMKEYAVGLDIMGGAVSRGGGDMPAIPVEGVTQQMAEAIWLTADAEESDTSSDATVEASPAAELVRRARVDGTEQVYAGIVDAKHPEIKHEAYRIVAGGLSDIDLAQPEGDAKLTLERITLWIDKAEYVPLGLLMEGNVEANGKTTPMQIEEHELGYAPAGPLYEAREYVYRISGMMEGMSDKDRAEMEDAKKQVAEMKAKLEAMPEGPQKAMIMKMMKPQIDRLEQMTKTGEFSAVTDVDRIDVNQGPPVRVGPDGKLLAPDGTPIECRK